jgi:hypothetical protein
MLRRERTVWDWWALGFATAASLLSVGLLLAGK